MDADEDGSGSCSSVSFFTRLSRGAFNLLNDEGKPVNGRSRAATHSTFKPFI